MQKTTIGWTQWTSNPIRARHKTTGHLGWSCTKVSLGCTRCYSETLNQRWGTKEPYTAKGNAEVDWWLNPEELPQLWSKGAYGDKIFLGDMTDLFHEQASDEWLDLIFGAVWNASHRVIQTLTKRPERQYAYWTTPDRAERIAQALYRFLHGRGDRQIKAMPFETVRQAVQLPLPNLWMGVSVEDQAAANARIPWLLQTPATVRFLSIEPLLAPIQLWKLTKGWHEPGYTCPREVYPLDGLMAIPDADWEVGRIHWTIIGGESGPGYRPMNLAWLESLVAQCHAAGVKVFVKQDAGLKPGRQGKIPDALWTLKEFPDVVLHKELV